MTAKAPGLGRVEGWEKNGAPGGAGEGGERMDNGIEPDSEIKLVRLAGGTSRELRGFGSWFVNLSLGYFHVVDFVF